VERASPEEIVTGLGGAIPDDADRENRASETARDNPTLPVALKPPNLS
jgi:hypothetical protein